MAKAETQTDYSDLSVSELHEKAKDAGIAGRSHMRRDELLEALKSGASESKSDARSNGDTQDADPDADAAESAAEPKAKRGNDPSDDYQSMSVSELHDKAKEAGLSGTSHMKKDELIEALGNGGAGSGKDAKKSDDATSSDGAHRKRDEKGHFEKDGAAGSSGTKKTS